MINRELIRLKTVQVVYAYYLNDGKSIDSTEKELFHSLAQAYELYMQLLVLMMALHDFARRVVEAQSDRARMLANGTVVSTKFVRNRFLAQLKDNTQLRKFVDSRGNIWFEEEDFLCRLHNNITTRDFYVEYMSSGDDSYEEDREIWRKIYRHTLCNNNEIDELLEGMNLYWNDDKTIIDTFVLKTIKRFEEINGSKQELLPDFDSDDDKEFASSLLRSTLTKAAEYRQLISEQTKNWELSRMARIDLVITQVALAEILSIPNVPINVSINEYVEITKAYSTPRSAPYVNGMLDALCRRLIGEGKITTKTLIDK